MLAGSIGLGLRARTGNRRAVNWLTKSKGNLGTRPRTGCHVSALGLALLFTSYEVQKQGDHVTLGRRGNSTVSRVPIRIIRAKTEGDTEATEAIPMSEFLSFSPLPHQDRK